jgi:hypothetical protein
VGVWGLGFGVVGMGPKPQSPIPNPQSPIPNPQCFCMNKILKIIKKLINKKIINIIYIN